MCTLSLSTNICETCMLIIFFNQFDLPASLSLLRFLSCTYAYMRENVLMLTHNKRYRIKFLSTNSISWRSAPAHNTCLSQNRI